MPIKYMRREPRCQDWTRAVKARGDNIRISFKNTQETLNCLKGMTTQRAKEFLTNVIKRKEIVPFRRFTGGVGRKAQCKGTGCAQGRWPKKVAFFLLDLVRNLEQNANLKGLKKHRMYITHAAASRARPGKRRTYRAHGRINPFNSHPCHIEMFAEEKAQRVPKSQYNSMFKKNPRLPMTDIKIRQDKRKARKAFMVDNQGW